MQPVVSQGKIRLRHGRMFALCALTLFIHLYALLIVLDHRQFYGREEYWLLQNLILVPCSAVASAIFCLSRGRWASVLMPAMLFCYGIVGYSNGGFFAPDFLLLTSICSLAGLLLTPIAARVVGVSIAFLIVIVKWPQLFDGRIPPLDLAPTIAILVSYEVSVCVLAGAFRVLYRRLDQQQRMNERLDNAVVQLTNANLGFQKHAFLVETESAGNERRRISREIHDTVGYVMTSIIMMMEEAGTLLGRDNSRVRQLLQATRSQAEQGWNEARAALRALRALRGEETQGIHGIVRLARTFEQATGVKVRLELGNVPERQPEEIESAVYRFIQEGLTNSFRHGRATRIDVFFWVTERELRVTLRDNGIGASDLKEGIGLSGIHERLDPLGGTLRAHNVIDGFELFITIPFAGGQR